MHVRIPARERSCRIDAKQSVLSARRIDDSGCCRHCLRADFVKELSDEAIERHAHHGAAMPTLHSTMHLYVIDGAAHQVSKNDTAFSYRDANWAEVIVGVDPDLAKSDMVTRWCRDYFDDLHPSSAGGAYVNFMMDEGQAVIKSKYDPTNLFRVNQDIRPVG